jgi:hypothetical protein
VIAPIAGTRLTEGVVPPEIFKRMSVEFVAPAVLYMCSEQCLDSGVIINAGLGYFSRSAIMTGEGAVLSDGSKIPTPEEVMENWGRITSLESPRFCYQLAERAPCGEDNKTPIVLLKASFSRGLPRASGSTVQPLLRGDNISSL